MTTPPYVDPASIDNPTNGFPLPATWGDSVRDGLEFLISVPGAFGSSSVTTAAPTGTVFALTCGAADSWDTDGFHDPGSNNTRFTVPAGLAGRYRLTGMVLYSGGSGTNVRQAHFRVNGSVVHRVSSVAPGSYTGLLEVNATRTVPLGVGDYVELIGYQDSGIDMTASGWFQMEWAGR